MSKSLVYAFLAGMVVGGYLVKKYKDKAIAELAKLKAEVEADLEAAKAKLGIK